MNKNKELKKLNEKVLKVFRGDKKLMLIVGVGLIGMLILLASELYKPAEKEDIIPSKTINGGEYTYAQDLEKRLTELISSINGAGKTKVMVTLESGVESIYASQEDYQREKSEHNEGDLQKTEENVKSESEYIVIKSGNSSEEALIVKVIQPKVRGVAIVCEGGESVFVQQRIFDTVTAVLDISTAKVSIAKMTS